MLLVVGRTTQKLMPLQPPIAFDLQSQLAEDQYCRVVYHLAEHKQSPIGRLESIKCSIGI
jgi:hypothetical protein